MTLVANRYDASVNSALSSGIGVLRAHRAALTSLMLQRGKSWTEAPMEIDPGLLSVSGSQVGGAFGTFLGNQFCSR